MNSVVNPVTKEMTTLVKYFISQCYFLSNMYANIFSKYWKIPNIYKVHKKKKNYNYYL